MFWLLILIPAFIITFSEFIVVRQNYYRKGYNDGISDSEGDMWIDPEKLKRKINYIAENNTSVAYSLADDTEFKVWKAKADEDRNIVDYVISNRDVYINSGYLRINKDNAGRYLEKDIEAWDSFGQKKKRGKLIGYYSEDFYPVKIRTAHGTSQQYKFARIPEAEE